MRAIFYRVLEFFRWIFGVVPRSAIGSPVVFRVVHYTFWALLILCAALFSPYVRPINQLPYPWPINRCWLGIVILLCYLLGKLTVYVLGLLRIEDRPEFEDIERCWFAGMEALDREKLDFQWIPVFLVNGLTSQQEKSMFKAADIPWRVVAPPLEDSAAVLRFYANDEQIFISFTGVGVMNRQLSKPLESGSPQATTSIRAQSGHAASTGTLAPSGMTGTPPPVAPPSPIGTQIAPQAPVGTGTMVSPASAVPAPADNPPPARGGILGTLHSVGTFVAQRTMLPGAMSRVGTGSIRSTARVSVVTPDEIEFGLKRMEYVAELLLRDRHPYCPVNGMIQAAPLEWSATDKMATELSPIAVHDMRCLHSRLGLQFPVAFLLTGLDRLEGLSSFVRRCGDLDPRFKSSRAGSRFPPGAQVNEENSAWVIDRALNWFRGWVYAVFARELKNPESKKLYHLLCELQQRRERLASQLRLSFAGVSREPNVRLVGCYFAATGDQSNYQGFIKGLLLRLVSAQGDVAWTPHHIQSDARNRKFAYGLFAGAVLVLGATIAYWLWKDMGGA